MAKFKACVAVYGVLERDGEILMLRRKGSGYRDGQLSLPAGHLDGDDDAVSGLIRELNEELCLTVRRQDVALAKVLHRRRESAQDEEYVDLIFRVSAWQGEPQIGEPDKCGELVWVNPTALPADVVDYIRQALNTTTNFAALGWQQ